MRKEGCIRLPNIGFNISKNKDKTQEISAANKEKESILSSKKCLFCLKSKQTVNE